MFEPCVIDSFWSKVERAADEDCWFWRGTKSPNGYGKFTIRRFQRVSAHRYALACQQKAWPARQVYALHSCDHPTCCNPAHLRWGSAADNMADMIERGRHRYGGKDHKPRKAVRVTPEIVSAVADRRETAVSLAKRFGLSASTVGKIRNGTHWAVR